MRLVCFPYAGGDANIFRDWAVAMPEGVEVIGLLYPGRGCNQYPPPISNCDEMAFQLGAVVAPFFGIERVQEQLAELWVPTSVEPDRLGRRAGARGMTCDS